MCRHTDQQATPLHPVHSPPQQRLFRHTHKPATPLHPVYSPSKQRLCRHTDQPATPLHPVHSPPQQRLTDQPTIRLHHVHSPIQREIGSSSKPAEAGSLPGSESHSSPSCPFSSTAETGSSPRPAIHIIITGINLVTAVYSFQRSPSMLGMTASLSRLCVDKSEKSSQGTVSVSRL